MAVSLYDIAAPLFRGQLSALATVLDKGAAFAEAKKIDPSVLLNARLAPDMFALTRQVQIATDMARGCVARLAGLEPPKEDDNETSFADLKARVQRTIDYIDGVSPAAARRAKGRNRRSIARMPYSAPPRRPMAPPRRRRRAFSLMNPAASCWL